VTILKGFSEVMVGSYHIKRQNDKYGHAHIIRNSLLGPHAQPNEFNPQSVALIPLDPT
jgi:hypothetical protein